MGALPSPPSRSGPGATSILPSIASGLLWAHPNICASITPTNQKPWGWVSCLWSHPESPDVGMHCAHGLVLDHLNTTASLSQRRRCPEFNPGPSTSLAIPDRCDPAKWLRARLEIRRHANELRCQNQKEQTLQGVCTFIFFPATQVQ